MDELLNKVSELVDKANNIPDEIRAIVKAICGDIFVKARGKYLLKV